MNTERLKILNENKLSENLSADKIKSILEYRAKELAKEPENRKSREENRQVLVFMLEEELYAIEIKYIEEVRPLIDFTRTPTSPKFVLGVVNLRGNILSVIDMRSFLNLPTHKNNSTGKIIIINACDLKLGIIVNTVQQILEIPISQIEPPIATFTGGEQKYIQGITKDMIILLDIANLIGDKNIIVKEEVS